MHGQIQLNSTHILLAVLERKCWPEFSQISQEYSFLEVSWYLLYCACFLFAGIPTKMANEYQSEEIQKRVRQKLGAEKVKLWLPPHTTESGEKGENPTVSCLPEIYLLHHDVTK